MHEKCAELKGTEESLKKLNEVAESMDNLKKDLKCLPSCREAVKIYEETQIKQSEIARAEEEETFGIPRQRKASKNALCRG